MHWHKYYKNATAQVYASPKALSKLESSSAVWHSSRSDAVFQLIVQYREITVLSSNNKSKDLIEVVINVQLIGDILFHD